MVTRIRTHGVCVLGMVVALTSCGTGPEDRAASDAGRKEPWGVASQAQPPKDAPTQHPFHVNFQIDESVACRSGAGCDSFRVPRVVLYIRGTVETRGAAVSGQATARYIDEATCETLRPDLSSCAITFARDGRMNIDGKALDGGRLELRFTLIDAPALGVVMSLSHPVQGKISVPAESTYLETLKKVLTDSGLLDAAFQVPAPPTAGADTPGIAGPVFSGSFEWPARDGSFVRTVKGFGGFVWIGPNITVPAPVAPVQ